MKIVTKILSGLLIILLLLPMFTAIGFAENIEGPSYDFCCETYGTNGYYRSFDAFSADIWASDYFYDKISDPYILPFRYTVENLESDSYFSVGQAVWEATNIINADCGAFTEGVRRNEEVIITLLGMDLLNTDFASEFEKNHQVGRLECAANLASEVNDILGGEVLASEVSLEAIFSDIDIKRLSEADYLDTLSDMQIKKVNALEEVFGSLNTLDGIGSSLDIFAEFATLCNDINDVYNLYATICTLSNSYGQYAEALRIMSSEANGAMAKALKNVAGYCDGFISEDTIQTLISDVMCNHDVNIAVMLTEELIASFAGIWGAGIFAGVSVANFSIDALYNFQESNEIFYSMKALKEFDDSLDVCLDTYRSYVQNNNNETTSTLFMNLVDLKTKVFSLGMEYTVNFIDSTQDKGLINAVSILFGREKKKDEAISNMTVCVSAMQDIINTAYDNAYYFWPLYKADLLENIDYDRLKLIEEVANTPIPYIEVSVEDENILQENLERYRNMHLYVEDYNNWGLDYTIHFDKDSVAGTVYMLNRDININGRITIESGTLDLNGHNISCREVVMKGGTIKIGTGSITTTEGIIIGEAGEIITSGEDGSEYYEATSSGRIIMSSDEGTLNIGGNFILCSSKSSVFEAGQANLSGDLLVYRPCFECEINSRFNFVGEEEQLISSKSPVGKTNIFFGCVSFANENVSCDEMFAGYLVTDATLHFNSDITDVPEDFHTNGHKLTVNGDLSLSSGLWNITDTMEITGNFSIGNKNSTEDDNVGIGMTSADSVLIVDGNLTVYTQGISDINDGTVYLYGNLDAYAPFYFNYPQNYSPNVRVLAKGNNKVIFAGTDEQRISSHFSGENGTVSYIDFNYFESSNPLLYATEMPTGILSADSVINFPENIVANEYFDLNEHTLTVPGNLNLSAGCFRLVGTLNIEGDFSIGRPGESVSDPVDGKEYRLATSSGSLDSFSNQIGYLNVGGSFTICTNAKSSLCYAKLSIKGDFCQYGNYSLPGSEYAIQNSLSFDGYYDDYYGHGKMVIFCGKDEQSIIFEPLCDTEDDPWFFDIVCFENDKISANRFFGGVLGSDATVSFDDNLVAFRENYSKGLSLSNHVLTIPGDLNISSGEFGVSDGTVNVIGSLRFGTPGELLNGYRLATSEGTLSINDVILNVSGDFVYCSSRESGLLDGVLNLSGDFINCGNYYKSMYYYDDEIPENDNRYAHQLTEKSLNYLKVVFNGTDTQAIVQDSYLSKYDASGRPQDYPECVEIPNTIFNEVSFENSNVYSEKMFGFSMTDDMTLNLPENIIASPYIKLNGHTLTIPGNINFSGGNLYINDGTIKIGGDLSLGKEGSLDSNGRTATSHAYIEMYDGLLNINGGLTTCTNMRSYFENCMVNIGGDINLFGTDYRDNTSYAVDRPIWLVSGCEVCLVGGDYQKVYFEKANNVIELTKDYPIYSSVLDDSLKYKLFDLEDGTKSLYVWISSGSLGTIGQKSEYVLLPWENEKDNISEIYLSAPNGGIIKILGSNVFTGYSALNCINFNSPITICDFAFADNVLLNDVIFDSKVEINGNNAFMNVTANVYYHIDDGWTEDEMLNYGGQLSWIPIETPTPTANPTAGPSGEPTPTANPTAGPSGEPTPTANPTAGPSGEPTPTVIPMPAPHVCKGEAVAEVPATCTESGTKAYYKCECGKFYEDEACTKEIEDLAAWLADENGGKIVAKGHTVVVDKAVAATSTKSGLTEGSHCSVCNEVLTAQVKTTYTKVGNVYTTSKTTVAYAAPAKTSVKTIEVPATVKVNGKTYKVTSIEAGAFENCEKLTTVKVGSNVKTIGDEAFKGCKNLKTLTIGTNVTTIGENAFAGCTKLKTVKLNSKIKTIDENAFSKCTSLIEIVIPDKVTEIADNAFNGCTKLKKVTIGKSVKTIGAKAFNGCKNLTSIKILSSKLTKISTDAFKGISSKAKFTVPSKKVASYTRLIKASGAPSKVSVTKN